MALPLEGSQMQGRERSDVAHILILSLLSSVDMVPALEILWSPPAPGSRLIGLIFTTLAGEPILLYLVSGLSNVFMNSSRVWRSFGSAGAQIDDIHRVISVVNENVERR